jgi:hypothetical protein
MPHRTTGPEGVLLNSADVPQLPMDCRGSKHCMQLYCGATGADRQPCALLLLLLPSCQRKGQLCCCRRV